MEQQKIVDESLIFPLNPVEVIIKEDRPRKRRELGDIAKLAESIKNIGQIHPIVVDRDKGLVVGGRRLAACIMLGIKVRACYRDSVDPILLREMEIEENIQRKDMTPAEESLAVAELVEMKQQRYGKSVPGKEGGFTQEDVANLIGKSRTSVIESLQIAEMVKNFPTLAECKTKSEIKKAVKGLERQVQNLTALKSYEEKLKTIEMVTLLNVKADDYLKTLPDKSFDLFFTDPPYGIDIHDIAITTGGQTGGSITTTGTVYNDSEEYAKGVLKELAIQSFRITRATAHLLVFCAPSHFGWLSMEMAAVGWLVAPRPVIWIKRESGQNNQPEKWFSSAYEFILFARKPESSLILQGRPDWIQCDPVLPSKRVHQAEKPVDLCKELISRCCLPGQTMIDPCMGSGALVEAGYRMKMVVTGCDKDTSSYASAMARMSKLKEELK